MPDVNDASKSLGKIEKEIDQEISKIKSATELIENAHQNTEKTISEAEKVFNKFNEDAKADYKKTQSDLKELVDNNKKISDDLLNQLKKATDDSVKELKEIDKSTKKVVEKVESLLEKLEKIDFQKRFDNVDTTIGNVQSRLDIVENNLSTNLKNQFKLLDNQLEEVKQNYIYLQIGLAAVIIGVGGLLYKFWA